MEEKLIAPCGMNCGICVSYLSMKYDLKKEGFNRQYCRGCRPRGEHCTHMSNSCSLLGKGLVNFCFECVDYPCKRLKNLDKRYRTRYHMSMIENLESIREDGMERFLENQEAKWRCLKCGETICCHNGLCLRCGLDILRRDKKYRWGENP